MHKSNMFFAVILLMAFAACTDNKNKVFGKVHQVVGLKSDDATFLRLKDTAQAHLNDFIDSLSRHSNDNNYQLAVKSDFADGKTHEHMWTAIFKYKDGVFSGLLMDTAFLVKNIKKGNQVNIRQTEVEDWFIYDALHDKQTGYYSEKYLTDKMEAAGK